MSVSDVIFSNIVLQFMVSNKMLRQQTYNVDRNSEILEAACNFVSTLIYGYSWLLQLRKLLGIILLSCTEGNFYKKI